MHLYLIVDRFNRKVLGRVLTDKVSDVFTLQRNLEEIFKTVTDFIVKDDK